MNNNKKLVLILPIICFLIGFLFSKAFAHHNYNEVAYKNYVKVISNALKEKRIVPNLKHRAFMLGGYDYSNDIKDNLVQRKFVLGIGYQYKMTNNYNMGIMTLSNESIFGTFGIDF